MQLNPASRGEIFVLDDDAAARATLAGALTLAGFEVICFADGASLLARANIRIPLCVFLDVGVRHKCRFELLDRICDENWRAPLFASSAEASIPLAVDAVRRGAFDFIAKPFDGRDVVARVHGALGETSRDRVGIPAHIWDQTRLTRREGDVLERIALGESNKEIAQQLGLSSRTVEGYRANILRKVGVRSTTELVRRMFSQGGRHRASLSGTPGSPITHDIVVKLGHEQAERNALRLLFFGHSPCGKPLRTFPDHAWARERNRCHTSIFSSTIPGRGCDVSR